MREEDLICPICSSPRHFMYMWRGFRLFKCSGCLTETVNPLPSPTELEDFYQNISTRKMVRWRKRLKLVERAFAFYVTEYQKVSGKKPERFLDVGGGVGYYVRAALNRNIAACLLDSADDVLEFARNTLGVSWTVQGNIQKCASYFKPDSFDFVLSRHTIEHMLDPVEFITNIAKVLCNEGILEIETPNVKSKEQFCHLGVIYATYQIIRKGNPEMSSVTAIKHALSKSMSGVSPPKHLSGFTADGLVSLLKMSGFKILSVRQVISGHRVFDPLYYDMHRLRSRKGLGIPYYFFERLTSILMSGKGSNLAVLARLRG